MVGRWYAAACVFGSLVYGCSFEFMEGAAGAESGSSSGDDASGTTLSSGSASSSGSADASEGSSQGTASGPPTSSDASESTDPTTASTTDGPTTDASSTSGGPFDCETPALFAEVQLVAEATSVADPMIVVAGWGDLPGDPDVAYSPTAEQGTITFTVDVPCDGTYHVWGLVWDRHHGVNSCSGVTNPDAFFVRVAGGSDDQWSYGCQGCENADAIWAWTSTRRYIASGCQTEALSYDLQVGTNTIEFRNLEASTFDDPTAPNVAAIAGMAIANASDYDPNAEYAP